MAKKTKALSVWDPSFLDKDELGKLIYFEAQLPKHDGKMRSAIIEWGTTLLGIQSLLANHKGGMFTKWLKFRGGYSKSSAYNAMSAASVFGGSCPNLDNLEVSAMYVLAESGTPEKARTEALKIAEKGTVTHAAAKEIVAKHGGKPKAKPRAKKPKVQSQSDQPSNGSPSAPEAGGTEVQEACHHPSKDDNGDCPDCGKRVGFDTDDANVAPPAVPPVDYGKCPSCASTKWKSDETGVSCAKCNHPHGEPAGDVDDDRVSVQRSKTVKTVEALMRAFDDLNLMLPKPDHRMAIDACKALLTTARAWK